MTNGIFGVGIGIGADDADGVGGVEMYGEHCWYGTLDRMAGGGPLYLDVQDTIAAVELVFFKAKAMGRPPNGAFIPSGVGSRPLYEKLRMF